MKRLESPLDYERGTVTYEIGNGRRVTLDAQAVQLFGLARLMESYGVDMPTERVPVIQQGRRIGTLPPDWDPAFARSNSFMYDLRPGDFTREGDSWVVGKTMGASDVDCVVGFVRGPSTAQPSEDARAPAQPSGVSDDR